MKEQTQQNLVVVIILLLILGLFVGVVELKSRMPETTNYIIVNYEVHYPNMVERKAVSYVITKDAMENGIKPYVTSRKGTDILKITGGMTLVRSSAPIRIVSYKYKTVTIPPKKKQK